MTFSGSLFFYVFPVTAGLAFLVSLFVFRNKQLKHKQERVLLDLQLQEKEKELQVAREQLLDFAHRLAAGNELIQKHEEQNGNRQAMHELVQTVILAGQHWGRFRELFEQVYPGYLQRLVDTIPDISLPEIKLMALAKLNFSNKEMAVALGLAQQSIRVTWHRLRKKASFNEEGINHELVNGI
jgi:hypothetical protein